MERQQLNEHVSKCVHTVVSCKYRRIGCSARIKESAIKAHEEDDKLHLRMALDTVNSLQKSHTKNKGLVTFSVSDYAKRKKSGQTISSPFYTHPNGYHMAILVYLCSWETYLGIGAKLLKGEHDAALKWPFVGSVSVTLLNQLEDTDHFSGEITFASENDVRVDGIAIMSDYISSAELGYNPDNNTQYLNDDTLYFKVEVEIDGYKPWLECTHASTVDD